MSENEAMNEVATNAAETNLAVREDNTSIMISPTMDVSGLSIDEKADLLQRWTEAQSGIRIDDGLLNQELVVESMTVYQRDFIDLETGEARLLTYVAFTLEGGKIFKTGAAAALPFATQTARLLGYDPKTGKTPMPFRIMIASQKAEQGFKYAFLFKGLVKGKK